MTWKRLALVAVVAMLVLVGGVIAGIVLYTDHLYRDSYGSEYSYAVSFASNASLDNVEVYVPLPVSGAETILPETVSVDPDEEAAPSNAPPVTASVVRTEFGQMLAISAESFPVEPRFYRFVDEDGMVRRVEIDESEYDPSDGSMVAFTERSVRVDITVASDHSIDTLDPSGTEPALQPEFERQVAPCDSSQFETKRCYTVESRTRLSWDTSADARTTLWVEFRGENSWWVFGWSGNNYNEVISGEFVGSQDGWLPLTGTLETGWGNYRGDPPTTAGMEGAAELTVGDVDSVANGSFGFPRPAR